MNEFGFKYANICQINITNLFSQSSLKKYSLFNIKLVDKMVRSILYFKTKV